ncbi:agmatinase [Hyphomicrobium sp.]|uniref:agmatinase n=1 Tax=Hyphomicrobium sp. TaxID=82 RepID=UPI00356141D6
MLPGNTPGGAHASYSSASPSPACLSSEQTYSGTHTFLRAARVKQAKAGDFAILGVPLDIATSNRPGARLGPDAVRSASAQLAELKAYPGGFNPLDYVHLVDLGDAWLDYGFPQTIPAAIEETASNAISDGAFLCSLGGDHFISYPLLKAHARKHGPLTLIHFDAHTDTWTPRVGKDGSIEINHGTMFAQAIDDGLIVPSTSSQVGIRTWVDDAKGMNIFDNMVVAEKGAAAVAAMVTELAGDTPCYLTIDIDCLDPAFAPGTGTPVAGGLATRELLTMLRKLDSLRIVGCDVVEVAPAYDQGGITALAAATVVYDQVCRVARKNGAEPVFYPLPRDGQLGGD